MEAARSEDHIRLAELIASLSLATDLGLGQPLEHELGVCLSALELADRLGCSGAERSDVYLVALLVHVAARRRRPSSRPRSAYRWPPRSGTSAARRSQNSCAPSS